VTRLLSNLYKSQFVIKSETEKRVINSNDKITERMQEYIDELKQASLESDSNDGFVAGINAENVEVIESDETEVDDNNFFQQENESVINSSSEIIEKAKQEAEEILSQAKTEAENLKEEALTAAREEGLEKGRQEALTQLMNKQKELDEQIVTQQKQYQKKLQEIEPRLIDAISEVYDCVFQVQFKDKKNVLLYLVEKAMLGAEGCKQFRVHLSTQRYPEISKERNLFMERLGSDIRIDFIEDLTLIEDECLIETDRGIFDCGVGTQMQNLMKELKTLCL